MKWRFGSVSSRSRLKFNADMSVGLEDAQNNVEKPEEEEEERGEVLGQVGTAELRVAEDGEEPPEHEDDHGGDGTAGVDDDAEGESPGINLKSFVRILQR